MVLVLAVLGSACGTATFEPSVEGVAPTAPSSAPQPTASQPNTSEPATSTASTEGAAELLSTASWDDRYVVIYGNYATEETSAIRYLAASSNDLTALIDDSRRELGFALPFGVKVGNGQIDISDGPNFPAPRVVWPVECLGVAPDIDGDALLDDCDPYPTDGPLADWDSDGVVNPGDNCPTVFNPDQEVIYERSNGAACDPREGIGPQVWVVEPTVTLDAWNETRAGNGLEPLSMPTGPTALPPEVAAWCATRSDEADSLQALATELPIAYGLTVEQQRRLVELAVELSDLFDEYETLQSDPEAAVAAAGSLEQAAAEFTAIEERARAVREEMAPYVAPLLDSDLACQLER